MKDDSGSRARVHAVVRGQVQGVNFRYHATLTARRLGLVGWVANRTDGAVETVVEGEHSDVEDFVGFLHRGSPAARVEQVNVRWESPKGEFQGFRVRYP